MALRVASFAMLLAASTISSAWGGPPPVQPGDPETSEALPGDSCIDVAPGAFRQSSGPEVPGAGHMLVCDGTNWQPILSYNDGGEITTIGNQNCNSGEVLGYNGTIWECAAAGGSGIWELQSNVMRPTSGTADYANDDFVFGSPAINHTGDANHNTSMFFDKSKSSFGAGFFDHTNSPANIGNYSAAFGRRTNVTGNYALGLGYDSQASGNHSVTLGLRTIASGNYSYVFGQEASATQNYTVAFGLGDSGLTNPSVAATQAFGIFFGNQTNKSLTSSNTLALVGGSMVIDSVNSTINAISGGDQSLELGVIGDIGAENYCDEAGNNCFTAASVAGASGIWQKGAGDIVYYNSGTPKVGIGTATPSSTLDIIPATLSEIGIRLQHATSSGAGANLQEWRNGLGTLNTFVQYDGYLYTTNYRLGTANTVNNGLRLNGTTTEIYANTGRMIALSIDGAAVLTATAAGNVGIGGDTIPDLGTGGQLMLDVEGNVGAQNYCDADGNNCFAAMDVGGGSSLWEESGGMLRPASSLPIALHNGGGVSASGTMSAAWGHSAVASGSYATAWGLQTHAGSYLETSLGHFPLNTAGNATSWVATDTLFEIGNGSFFGGRANALTVLKNGNMGVGTATPQSALHIPDGKYLQAQDHNAGAPPAADCDHDNERGRLSIDTTNFRLYVCMGAARGWDYSQLMD